MHHSEVKLTPDAKKNIKGMQEIVWDRMCCKETICFHMKNLPWSAGCSGTGYDILCTMYNMHNVEYWLCCVDLSRKDSGG